VVLPIQLYSFEQNMLQKIVDLGCIKLLKKAFGMTMPNEVERRK